MILDKSSENIKEFTSDLLGSKSIVKVAPAMVGEDFGRYGKTMEKKQRKKAQWPGV